MQINLVYDSSTSGAPAAFFTAMNYVASLYDSLFTNNVTITINVGWGEADGNTLGSGALGESYKYYQGFTYAQIRNALINNEQNSTQSQAYSTLPTTDPTGGSTVEIANATAYALGLTSTIDQGWVGFDSSASWDFNVNSTPSSGQYDFIAVAEHEISEVLGRDSFLNNTVSEMDLFRYSANGVRDLTPSPPSGYSQAYFSINGGATDLDNWNPTPGNGDLGDWAGSAGDDSYLDYSGSGHQNYLTTTDL